MLGKKENGAWKWLISGDRRFKREVAKRKCRLWLWHIFSGLHLCILDTEVPQRAKMPHHPLSYLQILRDGVALSFVGSLHDSFLLLVFGRARFPNLLFSFFPYVSLVHRSCWPYSYLNLSSHHSSPLRSPHFPMFPVPLHLTLTQVYCSGKFYHFP